MHTRDYCVNALVGVLLSPGRMERRLKLALSDCSWRSSNKDGGRADSRQWETSRSLSLEKGEGARWRSEEGVGHMGGEGREGEGVQRWGGVYNTERNEWV